MTFDESVEYIHSLLKFGINPGLERVKKLLSSLGNPEKSFKCIHVAGTNGKGSVSTALSNILTDAGLKTALYTSPYVTDFLERVQFCGAPVEKSVFSLAVSKVRSVVTKMANEGEQITEFEALTAAAFLCFQMLGAEYAVLEVGLGGRLDATNVIDVPLVNVITSLSLDHTAILGDTIEAITFEKCGTVKQGGNVVCAYNQPNASAKLIKAICNERNNSLTIPDKASVKVLSADIFGTEFSYKGESYKVKMPGAHQLINMTAVIEASNVLMRNNVPLCTDNIKRGIYKTVLPARVEVVNKNPLIILDGGHNTDGAKAFFDTLSPQLKSSGNLIAVAGMMADKAVENSLAELFSNAACIYTVTPSNPRAMSAEELKQIASRYCDNVIAENSPIEAVTEAVSKLKDGDILAVVGSLYLAGEVRWHLLEIVNNL